MSWSRQRTPVAMTSSPIWSRDRLPFGDYPEAQSSSGEPQVLYGIHDGGIPGTGHPTNRGVDPYIATRGRKRLEHQIRRHPGQRPVRQRPLRLDPARSRRKPRHPRLRRRRNLLALLWSRSDRNRGADPPAKRRTGAGHGGLDPPTRRQARRLHRQGPLRQRRTLHLWLQIPV